MHQTSRTFETEAEAAAFMLGVNMASSDLIDDAVIDHEEPNSVLIDLPMENLLRYVELTREYDEQAKERESE